MSGYVLKHEDYKLAVNEMKKLRAERDRYKAALSEIVRNGGICTDDEGCPICIANKALEDSQ